MCSGDTSSVHAPQSTNLDAPGTNHSLLSGPNFLALSLGAYVSLSQLMSVEAGFSLTGLTWQLTGLTSDTQGPLK